MRIWSVYGTLKNSPKMTLLAVGNFDVLPEGWDKEIISRFVGDYDEFHVDCSTYSD